MRALLTSLVAVLFACGPACASTAPAPEAAPKVATSTQATVPGEYLVTLAPGAGIGAVEQVYGRFGIQRVQDLGNGLVLVSLREDPGLERMTALQAQDGRIQAVQPNYVYRAR